MRHKNLVIGTYKCGKTGRLLAKALGAEYTSKSVWSDEPYNLVIRYGNSMAGLPPERRSVMNYANAIQLSADKPRMRIMLLRNGVSAPQLYDDSNITEDAFPLIARPRNHFQGKNFHIVYNMAEFRQLLYRGFYFQQIIDKDSEFRLFIFNDRIIEACIKEPMSETSNEMVRNHGHGWIFNQYPVADLDDSLKSEARHSARISGLVFCAIDCCIDTNGKSYIFEVNSAPSLMERKVLKLASNIKEYYGLD